MIYIGADHRGFKLKEHIKKFLQKEGFKFVDVGPKKYDPQDDYPDYVKPVAQKVSKSPEKDLGILICGSGQGISIAANKFKHVRAALAWSVVEAKQSREHLNSNILALPADSISPHAAQNVVDTWLHTEFSTDLRHRRRVKKIESFDK
jgi:ribose 5-phosphate isomerase B